MVLVDLDFNIHMAGKSGAKWREERSGLALPLNSWPDHTIRLPDFLSATSEYCFRSGTKCMVCRRVRRTHRRRTPRP